MSDFRDFLTEAAVKLPYFGLGKLQRRKPEIREISSDIPNVNTTDLANIYTGSSLLHS